MRSEYIPTISKDSSAADKKRAAQRQKEAIENSFQALESNRGDAAKRAELEAQELMTNPTIGKRVMGGLVDVWRDKVSKDATAAENRKAAQEAIFDYFNADSWHDVLQKLEQSIGSELYAVANDLEAYEVVKLAIQKGVTGNTLVA